MIRHLDLGPREGRPIVLLHGFTGSAAAWRSLVVAALTRRRRLLLVDLPGHGKSGLRPGSPGGWSMERTADELTRLLDRLNIERADWIGYSMGGRVVLAVAVLQPARIRRLVLESASPGLRTTRERLIRLKKDHDLAREIRARGMEWFVSFWLDQPLFATQKALPVAVQEESRRQRLLNSPAALDKALRTLGAGAQPSFWDDLAGVTAPTLLLTGDQDEKFESIAREMRRALPNARHRSVRGAGHAVHLEAPREWIGAVVPFLEAPDPASPSEQR